MSFTQRQTETKTPTTLARRRLAGMFALGGVAMLAGAAQAQDMGPRRPPHGMGGPDMERHMQERIARMMREVGGSTEQKDKLLAIAKATGEELRPLREEQRATRQRGITLLAAPQIDRAALEQARTAEMQLADRISKRMLQSMADSAEVLTPEQRLRVAERMKSMRPRHHMG
jgi:Spy/CpxP family protein refolding chaperone